MKEDHGKCTTRACIKRGGWDGETLPVPDVATCIVTQLIAHLKRHGD
jgi:hypothetical protein